MTKAAIIYTWYNEARWRINAPDSEPVLGRYDSRDPETIRVQIAYARWAGFEALIAPWHGPETVGDEALNVLLRESPLPVYLLYELDVDGRYDEVRADLDRLAARSALRRTVFLYRTWDAPVARQAKALLPDWHVVTQADGGDSIFVYDTSTDYAWRAGQCFFFSPGFDRQDGPGTVRPRVDPAYFEALARWALWAQMWGWPWQIVPLNEYAERTHVEPAAPDYGAYLRALQRAWRPING